jgi:7-carboxy-7-deazaguanine synthase
MKIAINEVFSSIQGEGRFAGHPAIFVRMQGCGTECKFCDTKQSWSRCETTKRDITNIHTFCLDKKDNEWGMCGTDEVVDYVNDLRMQSNQIDSLRTDLVVITGGEPFDQPAALLDLVKKLAGLPNSNVNKGMINIETSGTICPNGNSVIQEIFNVAKGSLNNRTLIFLTLSPKGEYGEAYTRYIFEADQIKMLVGDCSKETVLIPEAVLALYAQNRSERLCFQPIWTNDPERNKKAMLRCIDMANTYGGVVSLQIHKFMGVR